MMGRWPSRLRGTYRRTHLMGRWSEWLGNYIYNQFHYYRHQFYCKSACKCHIKIDVCVGIQMRQQAKSHWTSWTYRTLACGSPAHLAI